MHLVSGCVWRDKSRYRAVSRRFSPYTASDKETRLERVVWCFVGYAVSHTCFLADLVIVKRMPLLVAVELIMAENLVERYLRTHDLVELDARVGHVCSVPLPFTRPPYFNIRPRGERIVSRSVHFERFDEIDIPASSPELGTCMRIQHDTCNTGQISSNTRNGVLCRASTLPYLPVFECVWMRSKYCV